jgi:hypothetical protein
MEEAEKTEWLKNFDAPCKAELVHAMHFTPGN